MPYFTPKLEGELMDKLKQSPTYIAAELVRHWRKDFPHPDLDYAIGELTRRIATALVEAGKKPVSKR